MSIQSRKSIVVRHQFEGFHQWRDAPLEVGFLRERHRHIFKVEVHLGVTHDDRQLEFFLMQREVKNVCQIIQVEMSEEPGYSRSCEMMAQQIFDFFMVGLHKKTVFKVVVSEDGENDGVYELI